ncbi:MAG TPA: hypothetical protein VIF62_23300 [Labilithrix sp.]
MLVSPLALAAPTAAQRETARRLMDEGKERTKSNDLQRALEAYTKAHEIMHVPTTGLAVARAHLALGHLVEARDVALEVIRLPRESNEPAVFDDARRRAKDLDASLRQRIPTVKILVKGGPATRVAVDDGEVAQLLLGEPVALNPGRHLVTAKNADGVEQKAEVDLAEREAKDVELTLPAPKPVTVVAPAEPASRPRDDRPSEGGGGVRDVLVYGGFGLAAIGLVAGTVTGVIVLSKAGNVKPQCENGVCDPNAQSDLDSAKSLATVSTVAFIAAGVGAAVGGIALALPKSRGSSTALQWNLGPGGAAVRGTF